jgi:hypothetical protein
VIWLTWRQFRTQALVLLGAVALVSGALALTGGQVADLRRVSGGDFLHQFAGDEVYKTLYFVSAALVYAVPAVVGAFWGAPLIARELEAGTHRLVWNQSVSRRRWLATKLGVLAAAAAAAGLIGLAVSWWCSPLDASVNQGASDAGFFSVTRLSGVLLGARGVVPLGYAVLALLVGVTAGLVVRRTVAAMALTFVAVISVQVLMPLVVQPHLLPSEKYVATITPDNLRGMTISPSDSVVDLQVRLARPGAWITTNDTVDQDGNTVGEIPKRVADCTPQAGGEQTAAGPTTTCFEQLEAAGYRQEVRYQPASRYWPLQWLQTGILLGMACVLAGFCLWRIRRDLS